MFKKALAVTAISGAMIFGGALAASAADGYPTEVSCTISPATLEVGDQATIGCVGLTPGEVYTFSVTGPGITPGALSSIVAAAATGTATVDKTADANGDASAAFTATAAGTFSFSVTGDGVAVASVTAAVTDPNAAAPGAGAELPVTGGGVSPAAIWIGVGALALGGGAIGVATVRRRQHS